MKLGKRASFSILKISMKINDENYYMSICKKVSSGILEGVASKSFSGASSHTSILQQAAHENRLFWHTLVFCLNLCVTCRRPPAFSLTSISVPPPPPIRFSCLRVWYCIISYSHRMSNFMGLFFNTDMPKARYYWFCYFCQYII